MRALAIGPLLLCLAALPALAQQLVLRGTDGREVMVTAAEIAGLPHASLRGPGRDPATYEGVPLGALLERVGAPQGAALRGPAFAIAVLVRARDGYVTVLSLAEADPGMREARVILADRRADGPEAGGGALPPDRRRRPSPRPLCPDGGADRAAGHAVERIAGGPNGPKA